MPERGPERYGPLADTPVRACPHEGVRPSIAWRYGSVALPSTPMTQPPVGLWQHPVWNVYDELRTARLNVYYYRRKLAVARRASMVQELVIAISSSAGVATAWVFTTTPGTIVWKMLGTMAALVAVYRTVARPTERVRKLESCVAGWTQLEISLDQLRRRVHEDGRYDRAASGEMDKIADRKRLVVALEDDDELDEELRRQCFERINQELPLERFYVPADQPA